MAYQLVATFLQMVRKRTGEQLDAWLEEVKASRLEAFASFVTSVQQDKKECYRTVLMISIKASGASNGTK